MLKVKILSLIVKVLLLALVNKPLQIGQEIFHGLGPVMGLRVLPSDTDIIDFVVLDRVHDGFRRSILIRGLRVLGDARLNMSF